MKCKICQNNTLKEINIKDKYYYCPDCGLIFIDDRSIPSAKKERLRYEEHNNSINNSGYVNMFKKYIDKTVRPFIKDIDTALDFGCGPGPVLARLLEREGINVDVYDPYFYPDKVYKGNCYDLITSTEVFEHLRDPLTVMKTLVKHIKSGGYLAIMTNFHPGFNEFKDWYYHRDYTHITFYDTRSLARLIEMFPLKKVYEDGEKCFLVRKY